MDKNKFISFNKLSKKKQREENNKRRITWGSFDPTTRKPPNPRAYDRGQAKRNTRPEIEE